MDDKLIRYLKIFVLAGALLLAAGTGLLVWLLLQRSQHASATAEAAPTTLAMPADAHLSQTLVAGNQLVMLGDTPDGRRFLAAVDLVTGKRRYLLWFVPEAP